MITIIALSAIAIYMVLFCIVAILYEFPVGHSIAFSMFIDDLMHALVFDFHHFS